MQVNVNINFGYDQIFELARQLSPKEKAKLVRNLRSEDAELSEPAPKPKMSREEYYEFLMNGPVLSEEEIQWMEDAKKMVDQIQPISL